MSSHHHEKKFDCKTMLGALSIIASVIGHTAAISSTIISFLPCSTDEAICDSDFFSSPNYFVAIGAGALVIAINALATWVHAKIDQSNQSEKQEKLLVADLEEGSKLLEKTELTRWQKLCVISDMLAHILDNFSSLALAVTVGASTNKISVTTKTIVKGVGYGVSGIFATLTNLSAYRSCKKQLVKALYGVGDEKSNQHSHHCSHHH